MVDIFAALFCFTVLIYACQADLRKRSVSNIPWILILIPGIFRLIFGFGDYGTPVLFQAAISATSTLVITYLFFRFNLFGAADAKCLISISVLFPMYPSFVILSNRFPLIGSTLEVFPFALTTLMNAALFALVVPLFLGLHNLLDLGLSGFYRQLGMVFIGFQVPVEQLGKKRHIRLISPYSEGGKPGRTNVLSGVEIDEKMVRLLENYQKEGKIGSRVWVTPELPFMVFITLGFLTAILAGNLVFALVEILR